MAELTITAVSIPPTDPIAGEPMRKKIIPLSGKLITAEDPLVIGENFRTLKNMRYTDSAIKSIGGMTKFNPTPLLWLRIRSGHQFRKAWPQKEPHLIVQTFNGALTESVVVDNQTVITGGAGGGGGGDFSDTTGSTLITNGTDWTGAWGEGLTFYYSYDGVAWTTLYNKATTPFTDTTAQILLYTELSTGTYADDFVSSIAAVESDDFAGVDSDPPDAGRWTNAGLIIKSNTLQKAALGTGNVISVGSSGAVAIDFRVKTYIPSASGGASKQDSVFLYAPGVTGAAISHRVYTSPDYRILSAGIDEDLQSKNLLSSDTTMYLRVTIA